jgi:hypothetical protein
MANSLLSHDKTERHLYGLADADAGRSQDGGRTKAVVENPQGRFGTGDIETILGEGDPECLAETTGTRAEELRLYGS